MYFKLVFIGLLLTAVIVGCNSQLNQSDLLDSQLPMDESLQGNDRKVLIDFMKKIPEEHRENVFYVTEDDRILTNKRELQTALRIGEPISQTAYRDQYGEISTSNLPREQDNSGLSIQALTPYSCIDSRTGAYRRISTKTGFSYANMAVLIPSKPLSPPYSSEYIAYSSENPVFVANPVPPSETPYIILGGRTSAANSEVDATLQYNPLSNDWSQVIYYKGKQYLITNGLPGQGLQYRVPPTFRGSGAALIFYVEPDDRINFNVSNANTISIPAKSWKKNGRNQILKFTTSIAQNVSDYTTTSYMRLNVSSYVIGTLGSNNRITNTQIAGNCKYPEKIGDYNIVTADPSFDLGLGEKIRIYLVAR